MSLRTLKKSRCSVRYADSNLHRVGFSEFCNVDMYCIAIAELSIRLVECVKCNSKLKTRKFRLNQIKPFMFPFVLHRKDRSVEQVFLPVTCHCSFGKKKVKSNQ